MARNYKVNKIKVDIGSYRHYWRGIKKIGKTTLFRDLILEEYGDPSAGLLISMGNETGYQALDGLTFDEAQRWEDFIEIADDLVANRKDNNFKLIAFDTVDELVNIAIDYAMRLHKSRTGKDAKSVNEILGGYGAGRDYIKKSINQQISRLEKAGYGLVFIGHTKLKDIKETAESEGYQQLTSNLSADYDGIFADKADILATFYNQRIIKDGVLKDKERYIYFRNDGFIDCGSRFKGMPDKVEMSAKSYLEAFEQGVKSSMTDSLSKDEMKTLKAKEVKDRKEKAEEYVETENIKELQEKVLFICDELKVDHKEEMLVILKSADSSGNPNKIKDANKLKELYKKLEELKGK